VEQRVVLDGLTPDTEYEYAVYVDNRRVAKGNFTTAPVSGENNIFRLAFGEFTFDTKGNNPSVTFRLIDEHGNIYTGGT